MERQDLMNKLLMYMNSFTLKEFKIQTMISQRKLYDNDLNNMTHSLRNQPVDNTYNFNFSPSIVDIELNDEYTAISNSNRVLNPYIHNDNHRNMSGYMTKEFELILNDYVNKQQHLLHYNSVPFLVNACCNEDNEQLKTLKYFSDNDENIKLQVNKLNTFHEKNRFLSNIYKFKTFKTLRGLNEKIQRLDIFNQFFTEKTIYQGIISLFNFDNLIPIPSHLEQFNIEKPSIEDNNVDKEKPIGRICHSEMKLDDRIDILEQQNYRFNESLFTNILQVHHREINKEFGYFINKIDTNVEHVNFDSEESLNLFDGILDISSDIEESAVDEVIKKLQNNVLEYYNTINRDALNKLQYILEFINIDFFDDDIDETTLENKIILINRINRLLTSIIPSNILNGSVNKKQKQLVCKHWNLAKEHYGDLCSNKLQSNGSVKPAKLKRELYFFSSFTRTNINTIEEFYNNINIGSLYSKTDFTQNYIDNFDTENIILKTKLYIVLLFYILNKYITDASHSNSTNVKELQIKVIHLLEYVCNNTNLNYESIKNKMKNIKQAEKKVKTDFLKSLTHDERRAENKMKELKLGNWSAGLNIKNLTQYHSKNYAANIAEATLIHDMMENSSEQINVMNENEGDDNDMNSEMDNEMQFLPEDDDYGNNMDGDEGF